VAGQIGKKENEVFKDLLSIDVIRGPDSTGIASLTKDGDTNVFKRALLPADLFTMAGCNAVFNSNYQNLALIGHNRWATKGKIKGYNAHPFEFDTLVGCHNGTLRNQHELVDHLQFDVDSENLFHSFEKVGVNETIKNVDGAFALVWASFEDKTMHFLRNDERSLYYTFSADNKKFFWASESWMLEGVLQRNGVEHLGVMSFSPNHHYTLHLPTGINKGFDEAFFMSEVEVYEPPKCQRYDHGGSKGHSYIGGSVNTKKQETNGKNESRERSTDKGDTKRTYQKGEVVTFRVARQTPTNGQRYIYGVDTDSPLDLAGDTCRFSIYLPAGSAIRNDMLENPDKWWEGVINGFKRHGDYVIQGNSVEEASPSEGDDCGFEEEEDTDLEREAYVKFIEGTDCAWCSSPLHPTEDNLIANSLTIFCPSCRKDPAVQQFLPK